MNTPTIQPTLTGSWRNFSPKLDARTAQLFNQIEQDSLELLRNAGRKSSLVQEEPTPYQAAPQKA